MNYMPYMQHTVDYAVCIGNWLGLTSPLAFNFFSYIYVHKKRQKKSLYQGKEHYECFKYYYSITNHEYSCCKYIYA